MNAVPATPNESAPYDIYTGVWTDWSHNKILGATLTTTRAYGTLLNAFISLFVAVVGTSFWRISCFILHHICSTEASQNGIYHQRQAILRNAANATTGITSLFQIFNAWRGAPNQSSREPCRRVVPLLVFSCLTLVGFAVASTFSSRISNVDGSAVLIKSNNCGIMTLQADQSTVDYATVFLPYLSERFTSSADYAQRCYPNHQSQNSEGCNTMVQKRLGTKVVRDAACPFPGDICKSQNTNLLLDTGLVDSHGDLGMNAPPDQRYQFRFVLQAAPLRTKGFKREIPGLTSSVRTPYVQYQYGMSFLGGSLFNYTYEHAIIQKDQFHSERGTSAFPNMDIKPIPELKRTDADLYIAFLSLNSLLFPGQSDDLWYSAHDFDTNWTNILANPNESIPMYWSDEPASPLGIVLQYQLCKPALPVARRCTPLSSFQDAYSVAVHQWDEIGGNGIYNWWFAIVQGPSDPLTLPIEVLGPALLDSKSRTNGRFIGPLKENQWQIDVERWTNITLASIQQSFIEAATGPPNQEQNWYLGKPGTQGQKRMCNSQKILSAAYINFSVFGLSSILVGGGLIIILSYTIEPLVKWVQVRRNLDVYSRLEWTMNETLQLQRLAHEELGVGTWHRCDTDIPVTERITERLAVLDPSDRTHPRLKAPPVPMEDLFNEDRGEGKGHGEVEHNADHP